MFANRIMYTKSPGGIRRGLIWQSGNAIEPSDYKWVDRYTIGSTTIDGEDYTLAMGYTFPGVLAGDDFQIPLHETSPIQVAGVYPRPGREDHRYGYSPDYYFLNYTIQPIFDHVTLLTTFGSLYPDATEALYRSAEHQYMKNLEHAMTRVTDANKSMTRNLIKPVYSAFWVKRGEYVTVPDGPYMPAGTYPTNSSLLSRGAIEYPGLGVDTDFYRQWLTLSELERRYAACPDLYQYILTDKTTKIKVPRKALVTDRTDAWTFYQPYDLSGGVATLNERFRMNSESMIGHVDGHTHNYQPRWNTRALWRQTYDSDEQQYVDDYYVMYPTGSSIQSMSESRIYYSDDNNTIYARLKPLIPERSTSTTLSPFAPVWYGPVIGFGNYLSINNNLGMTDFYIDNALNLTSRGHLVLVLNGYECEYTSLNEVDMT